MGGLHDNFSYRDEEIKQLRTENAELRAENAGMEMLLNDAVTGAKEHEAIIASLKAELEETTASSAHKMWAALLDGELAINLLFLTREDAMAFMEANNEACKREKYRVARVEIRVVE